MKLRSLRLRLIGAAIVWTAIALSAGGAALSYGFRQSAETAFDTKLEILLRGVMAAIALDDSGELVVLRTVGEPRFEQVYSGWYWQIADGAGLRLRSRSLWDRDLADVPSGGPEGSIARGNVSGPRGRDLRTLAQAITIPRYERPLHVIVAGDVAEIEAEAGRFDLLLTASLGFLGIGLIVAILLQVGFGLRPLRRLAGDLDRIRRGEATHLAPDYPDEVAPLVGAMNAVLDHDRAQVERARTHVGNLAHGLKTPLTILKAEVAREFDPARIGPAMAQVTAMTRLIDHHLTRAAAAASADVTGARTDLAPVVAEIRSGLLRAFADRALEIVDEVPPGLSFRGERQDLEEMLGNLMENACKWARARIVVSGTSDGRQLRITVDDDGPGMAEDQTAPAVERGKRLDEQSAGSGLGLAIVKDIAELYGGELTLDRSPLGGLGARLRLPTSPGAEE